MKGMIIAAGFGSRFLPATKSIPKEMFPLIDRPAIDFIVEEFIQSGITDILIVTSRRKKSMEDYFDREIELEQTFTNEKAKAKLEKIHTKGVNIFYVRQMEMRGTGDAVLLGKEFLNSPFVLAYPDDLIFSSTPLAKQLIDVYNETGKGVLSVMNCLDEDVSRYGVIDPRSTDNNSKITPIKGIVEKPKAGTEPSKLVSIGRYLLTPEIFPLLVEGSKNCTTKEFFLTDALNILAHEDKLTAYQFDGTRYDTGEPMGYLKTLTEYALTRDDLKEEYFEFLKDLIQKKG